MSFGDGRSSRPNTVFKHLRRMHGHNLDSGLNDLTEAFAAFMTRARYFSIGHLRRTWSHSAVEFMKYRRRLPALLAGSDDETMSSSQMEHSFERRGSLIKGSNVVNDPAEMISRRVYVTNIPSKVTNTQLASFFSKFGRVVSCSMQTERVSSTIPRRSRGCAYVTFASEQEAHRALNSAAVELIFYQKCMSVAPAIQRHPSSGKSGDRLHQDASLKLAALPIVLSIGAEDAAAGYASGSESDLTSAPLSPISATSVSFDKRLFDEMPPKVLTRVFACLNIFDRIRLERVCKRFQEASFESWSLCKTIAMRRHFMGSGEQRRPLHNATMQAVLRRAGPYLKSLDISGATQFLNEYSLNIVAQQCPKLCAVNLTGLKTQWIALKVFAETCGAQLETVIYRDAYFLNENAFWWLFRSCPNLKSIDLTDCSQLTGMCFRSISSSLETIRLDGCKRLQPNALQELCLKCRALRHLSLDECQKIGDSSLASIARSFNELDFLSMRQCNASTLTSTGLKQLAHLPNLQSLQLDRVGSFDDSVLDAFCNPDSAMSKSLKRLTLADSGADGKLSKASLQLMSTCPDLKLIELDLSGLHAAVDDETISNLSRQMCDSLEVLRLRGCSQIGNRSVEHLAENCSRLTVLDLSGCFSISNDAIRRFFYTQRSVDSARGCCLNLILGGTSCDISSLLRQLEASQNAGRIILSSSTDGAANKTLHVAASSSVHTALAAMKSRSGARLNSACSDRSTSNMAAGGSSSDADDGPGVALPRGNSDSDDEPDADDEFESLIAQRSYVLDELEEDDLMSDHGDVILADDDENRPSIFRNTIH